MAAEGPQRHQLPHVLVVSQRRAHVRAQRRDLLGRDLLVRRRAVEARHRLRLLRRLLHLHRRVVDIEGLHERQLLGGR